MGTFRSLISRAFALLGSIILMGSISFADETHFAKLYNFQGKIEVKRGSKWIEAKSDGEFLAGDLIRTLDKSRAALQLDTDLFARLGAETSVELLAPTPENPHPIKVIYGTFYIFSRTKGNYPVIETPFVSAAIRGTELTVEVTKDEARVTVLEGRVLCENKFGKLELNKGEQGSAKEGSAPVKTIIIKPEEAVQWAVHIPSIFNSGKVKNQKALLLLQEASANLTAGDLARANENLIQAEKSALDDPDARSEILSMRALSNLAANENESSRKHAEEALRTNMKSPSAAIALSYSLQSAFKIEEAARIIEDSIKKNPDNALLLARYSELKLSLGEIESAAFAIEKALSLSRDSHVLTVLGFVRLSQNEGGEAAGAFNEAMNLGASSGLSHLGLGLSKISEGKLEEGREFLAQAVALEPSVSLFRSYLGKSYFEERKGEEANREYARAIDLDPNDPTPYLYRSYYNLSVNKPVQALLDLENSYKLNDSRAVYRSRLLLDQDYAVRSASLAEVYQTLGFRGAARIEAIKSINDDYSNFAAHLFLGGLANDERIFDLRDAEYAVSNLLSPINVNALRQASGGVPSFNEYTSLFDRLQTRTSSFSQWGSALDETIVDISHLETFQNAGVVNRFASVNGGGTKRNGYDRQNLFQLEGQYELTAEDRVFLRQSIIGQDNKEIDRAESDFESELYSTSLGYHHTISESSHIISQLDFVKVNNDREILPNVRFSDLEVNSDALPEPFLFENAPYALEESFRKDREGFRYLVEYIKKDDLFTFVSGGRLSSFHSSLHEDSKITLDDFEDPFLLEGQKVSSSASERQTSYEIFSYGKLRPDSWLDIDAGLNYANIENFIDDPLLIHAPFTEGTTRRNLLTPRLGTLLRITKDTTLRAAYFERLSLPDLDNRVTLEPSFVGGINQIYDDLAGTRSKNFGTGLDYKISESTYAGVEALRRDLEYDYQSLNSLLSLSTNGSAVSLDSVEYSLEGQREDKREDLMRSYIYQVVSDEITFTSDYSHSALNDDRFQENIDTNRLSLGGNYYLPSGYFMRFRGTWREQSEDFWLFDAGLGYRFPRRHGSVQFTIANIFSQDFDYIRLPSDGRSLSEDCQALVSLNLDF